MGCIWAFGQACVVLAFAFAIFFLIDVSVDCVEERKRSRRKGR